MKKEIKFSAKLDSAEFDRSIEQMQRKLKEIYAPSDALRQQSQMAGHMERMGLGGTVSKPTQDQMNRATQQARRETDQFLANEIKQHDRLQKIIEQRTEKIKKLREAQAGLTKDSQEELKVKERIARMEENTARMREVERGRAQAIGDTVAARERMEPKGFDKIREAYDNGGIKGAAAAGRDMMKGMNAGQIAGIVGSVLTTTGIAAKIGGELYREYKQAPINTASSYGSAMGGVFGREVNAAYSGRSALEMAFLPEKNEAMRMAREAMKGERVGNALGATGSVLGYAGAGVGTGATLGSIIPGVGTAVGGVLGGLGGAGYGMYKSMTGEGGAKNSALMKSLVSDTHNQEYEAMMAQEFASKYNQAYQGLKDQNPYKTAAAEQYDSNYMRYLDSQRSMGLNNANFHGAGGFRENAINAGFTDNMALEASSGILSAGGSTRMSRDSIFALQAAQQFDQTNATGVLGQLSGSLGSSESSKQAYVKMLAEGTRQGLDTSEYREESRKMMEVTASAVAKSGVSSSSDIDRIISQMGGFLSDKSNRGVQSAKEAFDYYNQASSEVGGPRGTMRAAGMMRDKNLGQMDAMDRAALAQIPADQLNEEDPAIKYLAQKYNMSPKDMINSVLEVNRSSFNFRPGTDKAMNKARDLRKQISELGPGDEDKRKELQGQLDSAMGEFNVGLAVDNMGMSTRTRTSLAQGLTSVSPDEMKKVISEAVIADKMVGKGGTGRMEDQSVAGAAEGSRVVLENFNKFSSELAQSPENIRAFNEQMAKAVEILQRLPAADRAKAMGELGFGSSQTQTQGGKSK